LLVAVLPARAQVCAGYARLSDAPIQIEAGTSYTDGASSLGGSVTAGRRLFAGVGLGATWYDRVDGTSFDVGGSAGYEVPLGARAALCPGASVQFSNGPDAAEVDVRTWGVSGGVSVGWVAAESGRVAVAPSARVSLAWAHRTFDSARLGEFVFRDTYGVVGVGVGFVVNRTITIRPGLSFPFGLGDSEPTIRIGVSWGFGRRVP
jgi:hypothetical protein